MQFDTDANVVRVKCYSPIRNDYLTDGDSQFNLPLDLRDRFGPSSNDPAGVQQTISFRSGANGYNSTQDTFIDASAPAAIVGTLDGLEAILAANATFTPDVAGGLATFDVTESLFA